MNEDKNQATFLGRGGGKSVSVAIANLAKENAELKSMIKALLTFVPDRHEELIMRAKKLTNT